MSALTFNPKRAQVVTFGAAPALNCDLGGTVTLSTALTLNITWAAPSNVPPAGEKLTIAMTQDGTGGYTVSWNAAYIFPTAWSNTGQIVGQHNTACHSGDLNQIVGCQTSSVQRSI